MFLFKNRLPNSEGRKGSIVFFMLLVPKKQNKVTEERGNVLKAFGFFFLLQIKN